MTIKIKYKRFKSEDVPELCLAARKEFARSCPKCIEAANVDDVNSRLSTAWNRQRVQKLVKAVARMIAKGIKSKTVLVHVLPALPWMLMFMAFLA